MFQLSSASTLGLHTNPASTTDAIQDTFEASNVHCVPRYIFKYSALKPGAQYCTCPQRFGKWQGVGENIFYFLWQQFLLVTEFSAIKQKNVKLPRGLKPFCLFVFLPLPMHSNSFPPLSDPFLKLDPRLCNLLLRYCICIMYSKHRIGRRAVKLLEN